MLDPPPPRPTLIYVCIYIYIYIYMYMYIFAGYGVWFGPLDPRNMAQPLEGEVQTVNRAELSACIAALRVVPRGQALRVVTDSKYVYDGVLKHLRRWRLQGRPFVNSDLWLQLQAEVDARTAPTL